MTELEVTKTILNSILETMIISNTDDDIQDGMRQLDETSRKLGISSNELLLAIVIDAVKAGKFGNGILSVRNDKLYVRESK